MAATLVALEMEEPFTKAGLLARAIMLFRAFRPFSEA